MCVMFCYEDDYMARFYYFMISRKEVPWKSWLDPRFSRNPKLKTTRLVYEGLENSGSGSTITREEGLAPSRRPFENGTK